jgi:hypothetical protein
VSSDKVKALESKIQTLETALAEALKRSGTVKTPQPPATSQQVPETAP